MYKNKIISKLIMLTIITTQLQSMAVLENLLYKTKGFGYTVEGLEKKIVNSFWSPTLKRAQFHQKLEQLKKNYKNNEIPKGMDSYRALNAKDPFVIGTGIGGTQTWYNTAQTVANPHYMSRQLKQLGSNLKQNGGDPLAYLTERRWYTLTSLPKISCQLCGQHIDYNNVGTLNEEIQNKLIANIATTIYDQSSQELIVTECPYCEGNNLNMAPQTYEPFDKSKQNLLVQQLDTLGALNQAPTLPTCRFSIELSEILNDDATINHAKLSELAQLVQDMKNPLLFIHHYANPQCKPHLFESYEDIEWFANVCKEIIAACPNVTHVCPISQPLGFANKVSYQRILPPFHAKAPYQKYVEIIAASQQAAARAMKAIKREQPLKVLASHQWKPMRQSKPDDYKAKFASSIADVMYNKEFIRHFSKQVKDFDGIALSIYPALYFEGFKPKGDNCSGIIDPEAAFESIYEVHEAFPDKEIFIVEAGCNCNQEEVRIKYIDTLLYISQLSRELGIAVQSCFFWGHTNDKDFYREWNFAPHSTHFGFFKDINPTSINQAGRHLQAILKHPPQSIQ